VLRDFTIADLGALNTVRQQALFLNNRNLLTRGPAALTRRTWLAPLSALTGVHTALWQNGGGQLIGQAELLPGTPLAALSFLAPHTAVTAASLTDLVEYLLKKLGPLGVEGLLAELDEHSAACAALRQAGFSIYARQRIWKLSSSPQGARYGETAWRPALERDVFAVNVLRQSLLPGQVQQLEDKKDDLDGYVYDPAGHITAFAEVHRGPSGIWVQPFVHLDAEPFHDGLADLLINLRPRPTRPVYISVRTYQDWLEPVLEQLGGQPGPRQVAMARRTVLPLKVEKAQRVAPAATIEPTTPIHVPSRHPEPEWMNYDQTPNYR
jgi:hypothetical protein